MLNIQFRSLICFEHFLSLKVANGLEHKFYSLEVINFIASSKHEQGFLKLFPYLVIDLSFHVVNYFPGRVTYNSREFELRERNKVVFFSSAKCS